MCYPQPRLAKRRLSRLRAYWLGYLTAEWTPCRLSSRSVHPSGLSFSLSTRKFILSTSPLKYSILAGWECINRGI